MDQVPPLSDAVKLSKKAKRIIIWGMWSQLWLNFNFLKTIPCKGIVRLNCDSIYKSSQTNLAYKAFLPKVYCWKLWALIKCYPGTSPSILKTLLLFCLFMLLVPVPALTHNSTVNILTLVGYRAWDVYFISLLFHTQLGSQRWKGKGSSPRWFISPEIFTEHYPSTVQYEET